MSFPDNVDDLIVLLDKTFPEPAIGHGDTMDKIKFEAGARSVVRWLKQRREQALAERLSPNIKRRGQGRRVRRQATEDRSP